MNKIMMILIMYKLYKKLQTKNVKVKQMQNNINKINICMNKLLTTQ